MENIIVNFNNNAKKLYNIKNRNDSEKSDLFSKELLASQSKTLDNQHKAEKEKDDKEKTKKYLNAKKNAYEDFVKSHTVNKI
jgi:hypothetical protein